MYKDIKKQVNQIWDLDEERTNPPNDEDFRKILNGFSNLKKDLENCLELVNARMNILINKKDYPPEVLSETRTFVEGFIPFIAETYGLFCGRLFQIIKNEFSEDVFNVNNVEFDIIHDKFSTWWHPPNKESFFVSIYNGSDIGWPGCNIAIFYPNPSEKHPFAMAKKSFYYVDDFMKDLKERI